VQPACQMGTKTLEAIQVVEVEASRRARSDGSFRTLVKGMTKVSHPGAGSLKPLRVYVWQPQLLRSLVRLFY
jgi:hypothetical protein